MFFNDVLCYIVILKTLLCFLFGVTTQGIFVYTDYVIFQGGLGMLVTPYICLSNNPFITEE